MAFTNFNNLQLFYTQQGNGFPLVFIHGFCEDASLWNDFILPFTAQYQVITIDLPGFGNSTPQPECSIDNYAAAVKMVLDTLNLKSCLLIGHSMGGYTALAFAEKYPNYLHGFCLFHSHPFGDSEAKKANRKKTIGFIQRHGNAPFLGQMIPNLFTNIFRKDNLELVEQMIDNATNYPEKGITNALEAMINRPNRVTIMEQSNVPIWLIIGKQDTAIPYKDSLRMSPLANITNTQILDNVGHMGMFEATTITQNIIQEFIDFCL